MSAPSLVAESLVRVADPLAAWLRPGPVAAPESVAAALARALLPPAASEDPPPWLRSDQRLSFARALAAVRRHRGAILADGVGTGKTYIGLGVAAALEPGREIHVLAPASLRAQWREAARRVNLDILIHSHETLSRGRVPALAPGPVIIDESHRLRTPSTRRYQTLAPWCLGRRGILLSATPAVNRVEDVVHQLLLFVRDDELAWGGIPSLRDHRALAPGGGALAHLVITGEDRSALLPFRLARDIRPEEPDGSPLGAMQRGIEALRLSSDRGTAGLLRVSLLLALASSPSAAADALARYRSLLMHGRDAAAEGRALSRQAIRRFVGSDGDQLVLWPLVAEGVEPVELALEDLEAVVRLEALAREAAKAADTKVQALARAVADRKPTLVFTGLVATVRYLRRHLGRGTAWCTGERSGVDAMALARDAVLDWFRKPLLRGDGFIPRPRVLVATDVAAEGLDLPLVMRVVHYDLPWTAVRLEQRSGRAFRLGGRQRAVEVVRFLPPPALEAAIRQEAILEAKSGIPDRLGLGREPDAPWRLRARVAEQWGNTDAVEGIAVTPGNANAIVAGFRIRAGAGLREAVVARTETGWTDDPAEIASLLDAAAGVKAIQAPPPAIVRSALGGIAVRVRGALRTAQGGRLRATDRSPPARRALHRMLGMAREAARKRDGARLLVLEQGLRFLRRGHTAGEANLVAELGRLPLPELLGRLRRLPPEPAAPEVERVELIGLLVVETEKKTG